VVGEGHKSVILRITDHTHILIGMTKKVIIPYFPKGIKYATPLLFGPGVYLIYGNNFILGALLILLTLVIITTNYVTEINLKEKRYRDYLSLAGIPLNEESRSFTRAEKIVITKGNYSQTINTRSQSRQLDWADYTGTLILDNDALALLTRTSKKELIHRLREFAEFLQVDVEDSTTKESCLVDLKKY
jgi:hypothetical protein